MRVESAKTRLLDLKTDLLVLATTKKAVEKALGGKNKAPSRQEVTLLALNSLFSNLLLPALKKAGFKAQSGDHYLFTLQNADIPALLLIVIDLTSDNFESHQSFRKVGSIIAQNAKKIGAKSVSLAFEDHGTESDLQISALLEGMILSSYQYLSYKTNQENKPPIEQITFLRQKQLNHKVIETTLSLCRATAFARDLVNMPPNDCTPPFLVRTAKNLSEKGKLKFTVFEKAQLAKMGANALLAVGKGSALPPALIKIVYTPKVSTKKKKVISLVGKGITFDTGGYSLKPADSMIGMHGDMAGAAAVLGAMQFVSELKPNFEVRAYIPTAENMISGEATRVNDIVKALNGRTIEILNTDAEGRLILADALSLASKDKADVIIDLATLTGACVVALGLEYAGLFTNDDKLATDLVQCGEIEGERLWRMPLAPEYKESLRSKTADLRNVTNTRWGGAIIGGLFLQNFVSDARWAHIDIAGPADALADKDHLVAGGVGFGVRSLARFLMKQ